jgi:phosphate transport system permease protein
MQLHGSEIGSGPDRQRRNQPRLFAPRFIATPLATLIELLAAVPGVVYGLWGLFVFARVMQHYIEPTIQRYLGFLPIFSGPGYGVGLLTASFILAVMIVSTITAMARDLLAGGAFRSP